VVEVRIEGRRLDVFEGFNFSLNYGIADIRSPEKRSTEYSKTIKCPATQNNDELLGHIYDINISNNYDANNDNISGAGVIDDVIIVVEIQPRIHITNTIPNALHLAK